MSQACSLERLELQAREYYTEYLQSLNDSDATQYVFAATMAGAHIRLWRCDRVKGKKKALRWDGWWSLWVTKGKEISVGDWGEYWDISDERHRAELERHFSYMISYPPTLHVGQTASTYGETCQAPVAPGMHQAPSIYSRSLADTTGPSTAYYEPVSAPGGFAPSYNKASPYYAGEPSYTSSQLDWDSSSGQLGGDPSYRPPEQSLVLGSSESQRLVIFVKRQPHMTSKDDFVLRDSSGEKRFTKAQDWKPTSYKGKVAMRYRKGDFTYVSSDRVD